MLLEAAVARTPVPDVALLVSPGEDVTLTVTYTDGASGTSQALTLTPGT